MSEKYQKLSGKGWHDGPYWRLIIHTHSTEKHEMTDTHLTRRRFLANAGCRCGGVALASRLGGISWAQDKPPVCLTTCRDVMLPPTGKKSTWSALRAVGSEGVEVQVADDLSLPNLFHPERKYTLATAAGVRQLAADAKAAGQRITAFLLANQFDARPEFEVKWCADVARLAQELGVPAIRIDAVPAKLPKDEFLKVAIDTLTKVMAATESTGVNFGIENHGKVSNDPAFLKAVFDGVGSKRLGLTLDTANFYWFGHPLSKLYQLYEEFAPRTFHTNLKSIHYPAAEREKKRPMGWKYVEYACPIDEGDIDFARVVAILQKAGYRGDLCVEDEFVAGRSPAEATRRVAKQIELLKRVRS
jgi:sugar phosphate isomerase/epimerase